MRRTSEQLIQELSKIVDSHFAHAVVECYVEMQQRFLAGDWQPTELDGKPLVLARDISSTDEVLLLLYHAANNRLSRAELREHAASQNPQNITVAISRLIKSKDIRPIAENEVALTPNGQKRILEQVLPKLVPQK